MSQKSNDGKPCLFLVPVPIGNIKDMTFRAIDVLKESKVIFCEDTRKIGLVLKEYNISKKLIINHDHNEEQNTDLALEYLDSGDDVAIVSDGGTPIISDPGFKIAEKAIENGYNVVGLPGATALIPALIMSGISPKPFTFYGFLNSKANKRKKELEELKKIEHTIIFYEAPHRLVDALKDMGNILGNRKISISREITKKYEEIYRGHINDILIQMVDIKGEIVIVVEGNKNSNNTDESADVNMTVIEQVDYYISLGYKKMDAIKLVASDNNIPKNNVYSLYHKECE